MTKKLILFYSYCYFLFFLACSGDGIGVDINGYPDGWNYASAKIEAGDVLNAELLFNEVQDSIFSVHCIKCHSGEKAANGLLLTPDESLNIMDLPSKDMPNLLIVKKGQPDSSYLIWKLEGREGIVGKRMPMGKPALDDDLISTIKLWIKALGSSQNST